MAKTGRSSFATFDTSAYGVGSSRLKPPPSLPEPEKQVFLNLISACPSSQFTASDVPLLLRFCELVVLAERAAEGLRSEPLVTADGKVSPWATLHASATKGMVHLSLRLKLSPQARSQRAPKTLAGSLSYYERQDLLSDDDAQQN
jgi:phage terminase small subunit